MTDEVEAPTGYTIDAQRVIAAQSRRLGDLTTQNCMMEAQIEQLMAERNMLIQALHGHTHDNKDGETEKDASGDEDANADNPPKDAPEEASGSDGGNLPSEPSKPEPEKPKQTPAGRQARPPKKKQRR